MSHLCLWGMGMRLLAAGQCCGAGQQSQSAGGRGAGARDRMKALVSPETPRAPQPLTELCQLAAGPLAGPKVCGDSRCNQLRQAPGWHMAG